MDFKSEKRKRLHSDSYKSNHFEKQEEAFKIDALINNFFKKSFSISHSENYILPEPDSLFTENFWEEKDLQKFKNELNETKSKLNSYKYSDWHQHTSNRNKAKDIEWRIRRDFDPEFVTQAWCKFHEIVSKFPLVPKESIFSDNNNFISLHLCEAPGAFITCLNHWLKTNTPTIIWDWLATTYNPYYEGNTNTNMISDDRFIMYTLKNWYFGDDFTGNLMTPVNLDGLLKKCKKKGKIRLITADGSINCIKDPGEQEKIVSSLHFCEVVAALQILESKGNFLLKIFTIFEHQTVCLIYLLTCVFKKIHFYKPVTSREGNSEIYVICLEFKGSDFILPYVSKLRENYGQSLSAAMFKKNDIPDSFLMQIISCAEFFKNHQCEVINNNISTYHSNRINYNYFEEKKIAKLVADKFFHIFPIKKLHDDLQIVGNLHLKKNKKNHWIIQTPMESYNQIKEKQVLEPVCHLLMFKEQFKHLELPSGEFSFKLDHFDINIDTCITTGKPFRRAHSSRFCPVQVAEIYKVFFEVVDAEENSQIKCPDINIIEKYEHEILLENETAKSIQFFYTDLCNNHITITKIQENLNKLQKGWDLVLFGYLLLTQFNVGLIYLLTHTFEKVEFFITDEIGCVITFKNFKCTKSILNTFEQIYESSKTAISMDRSVLSVIFVSDLYDSELYSIIEKLNNGIAKFLINYVSSINEKKN